MSLRDDEVGETIHNTMDSSSANADSSVDCHALPCDKARNDSLDSTQPLESTFAYKAPTDYKCHTFSGKISHITAILDKFINQTEIAMDTNWRKMPFDFEKKASVPPAKPHNLTLIINIAQALASPFSYVRVDLYLIDSSVIVGELTFTPTGGTEKFTPNEWDKKLGDLWR
ncbi:glycosyltransferase [Helicobacter canis]|uniref:Glycosyltransferase n=1 Tax=Helicobacter canis TaxID=29419 RepID=A0A377J2L1_9HELI|nr:glycosyltransferase [Helicobacter canis]STP06536.1 glycosyltransferase [Helicobacter canis]